MWNGTRNMGRFGKRLLLSIPVVLMLGGGAGADRVPGDMWGPYQNSRSSGMSNGNYREMFDPKVYALDEGESATFSVNLVGGQYKFKAICDDDCSDIDLEVRNSSGRLVEWDYENDDIPIVSFWGDPGRYSVRVSMERCGWDPCTTVLLSFYR